MTPSRTTYSAIAVAVATAICLWGGNAWHAHSVGASFESQSSQHLNDDVARMRVSVNAIERELDARAQHLASTVDERQRTPRELFHLLGQQTKGSGRGARIVTPDGIPIAWWGEDLRALGTKTYQFDTTNLYIIRARALKSGDIVQAFARIDNAPGARSPLHPSDEWVASSIFHGGFLRQESGTQRFVVEKRSDATLWIDVTPRTRSEVLDRIRKDGRNAAAVLIAIAAIAAAFVGADALVRPRGESRAVARTADEG